MAQLPDHAANNVFKSSNHQTWAKNNNLGKLRVFRDNQIAKCYSKKVSV